MHLARHRKNVSERVDRKQSVMIHTESGTACGAERMTYERLGRRLKGELRCDFFLRI